jgi:hypothetical protein
MAQNRRRSDPTGSYIERVEESDAYENIAGMIPGIGTAITISDIEDELNKEEPDYLKIGMLAGTEAIGLVPGLGAAAKSMIRKGADMARQMDDVIDVPSNIPQVSRSTTPSYTDADLLEADDIIFEWGKGNLTNPQLRKLMREKGFEIQTKNISPKMTGDDLEVVGPDGNILRWKDMPPGKQPLDIAGNPQLDNAEYAEKMAAFDVEDDVTAWKDNVKAFIKDSRDVDPVVRTPELEEAAQKLLDKEITREEYLSYVDKYKPVTGWDQLPREPSTKAMVYSLKPNQVSGGSFVLSPQEAANLGVKESSLSVGDFFDGRLDVTAYKEFDTWIVAGAKAGEKGQHYAKAVHYQGGDGKPVILLNSDNPKKYETNIKTGERIGAAQQNPRGETYGKTPYAAISGYVKDLDVENIRKQAEQLLNDPEWVQLGFDPRRQGNFYVRREKANTPLHAVATSAEEVIQIGPLVLAKNPVLDLDYQGYNEGGIAMDKQMDAVFKTSRTGYAVGGEVDPVSGNDVPPGSLPEEVRDDIPAQLSEGEYVVPADVVRYYGVKFFEDLRMQAKMGFAEMDAQGRIGGEPLDGMEIVEPEDDLPFDLDDLEVVEVIEMDEGGDVARRGMITSGDPDSPGGALGLGQEGLSLSSKSSVEMKKYVNEDGHALMILFINGDPITPIPEGYYLEEEGVEEAVDETTEEEVTQATDDGSTTSTATNMPEAIKYDQLTIDDMKSMVEDQGSVKGNMIAIAFGTMNPVMGLGVKLALRDQQRKLENEMKRRLAASDITAQERTEIEALLKATQEEKPNFLKQLFGDLTGKSYTPEVTAAEVTLPTTAAPEGLLDLPLDEMSKQLAPPEGFAIEEYQRAQERKSRKKREEMAAAKADSATYSDSGTESVIQSMKDRGASEAAIKEAEEEAEKVKSSISNIQKGVQVGFKKGGLASKKKK